MTPEQLRKIDALVAEHTFEMTYSERWLTWWADDPSGMPGWRDGEVIWEKLPHYSTDIAAAWEVLEKMKSSVALIELTESEYAKARASFLPFSGDAVIADENEMPLAICLAALKVKGVEVKR